MDDLADFSAEAIDSTLQPKSKSTPAPIRNNNPGALMPGGKLAQYKSPEEGLAALDSNLQSYGKSGVNTLSGVISKWAPPNSNNTAAYIAHAAKVTGLDPNQPIDLSNPYTRHQISAAIVQHENGAKSLYQPTQASAPDQFADFNSSDIDKAISSEQALPQVHQAPANKPQPIKPAPTGDTGALNNYDNGGDLTHSGTRLAAHLVTGLGSTVAGGVKGVVKGTEAFVDKLFHGGTLAESRDAGVNAGANAVRQVQQDYTYQPKEGTASADLVRNFDTSSYNPLNWPSQVGSYAGGKLADVGLPALGAAANAGITVFGAPLAVKGLSKLSSLAKPSMPITEPVEPTFSQGSVSAPKPRYKINTDGTATLMEMPTSAPLQAKASATKPPVVKPEQLAQTSPELQNAVKSAQAKGVPIDQNVLARHVDAETLPVPMKISKGQATLDPVEISNELNSRGSRGALVSPEFLNQQGKALGQNLDAIRSNAAPNLQTTSPIEHGQVLVDAYKAMDAQRQANISQLYQNLKEANGGELPLDGQAFASNAQSALNKSYKSRYLPPEVAGDLADFSSGRKMNYQQFEELRTTLANEARKAERAGDGNRAAAVSIVRDQLEAIPMTNESSAIKPLADAARAAARERFQAIKSDPAYKAVVNDDVGMGESSPLADNFVQKYVVSGKRSNIAQMRQNLQGNDLAQQTIPASTIDFLRKQAKADVESGRFNSATYNDTLAKLAPKFDVLTDAKTAQQLQQVGRVAKYTSIQPKGSFVNNSNTLVGAASDVGKDLLRGYLNVKTLGASGVAEKVIKNVKAGNAAKEATAPGAGMTKLSDFSNSGK